MVKRMSVIGLLVSVFALTLTRTASAHVVVRPAEVLSAGFQTFTVGAPNEKGIPFTNVKLQIPSGLKHVSVTSKPGWDITTEKEGEGEEAVVKSISWSGNTPAGFREDFTFSAQVPEEATNLEWKAYQTYNDGATIAWDLAENQQPKNEDGSPDFSKSGPFSITKVVKETEATAALNKVDQAAADAKKTAIRGSYIGITGIVLGLVGVYLATRKK